MDDLASSHSHLLGGGRSERPAWRVPLVVSALCHLLLFAVLVFAPDPTPRKSFSPPVINVDLVSVAEPESGGGAETEAVVKSESPAPPAPKAPEPVKSTPIKTKTAKVPPKPEIQEPVPLSPSKPKPKTSLKQKTFKSEKVLQSAIEKIEKEVETSRPDPLAAAFERLRQQVGKSPEGPAGQKSGGAGTPTPGKNKIGLSGEGGKEVSELKDIYRVEIAYRVQKNWAFSDQLAGANKNIRASLVFKVMPNGEIRDIFFTDRSGNGYLDESAYKAIVKSNPVDPHPPGLRAAYVEVGLRFGPEGLR